jgi:hypothetical protein
VVQVEGMPGLADGNRGGAGDADGFAVRVVGGGRGGRWRFAWVGAGKEGDGVVAGSVRAAQRLVVPSAVELVHGPRQEGVRCGGGDFW